jgi:hypothetical protein
MLCRSLFVLLYFFFWPLCCLFFFDIRILITPLVSSNTSCKMDSGVRLHGPNTCYVIFWDIAHKHWIYMNRGYCNSFHLYLWQTTQWPKEKVQKDKQRSTQHTYKTKDRVTRTPLKTEGELMYSVRVSCSCSTSDTRRVNLVTKQTQW